MPISQGRDLHVDAVLSNILIGRRPEGYVADEILPIFPVAKQSNVYFKRNRFEPFAIDPNLTARAPGAEAKNVFWSVSSDTYFAKNYMLGTYWTSEDEANADEAFNLNRDSAEFVTDRLLMDYEYRISQLAVNTSNARTIATINTPWSNTTGSRPFDDLNDQIYNFWTATGKFPNRLCVPEQVMRYLRRSDQFRDILFGDRGGLATDEQIANLLKIEKVIVPQVLQTNTAEIGQLLLNSVTYTPVWGNHAFLFYSSPVPGRMIDTWAQGFRWTAPELGVPWAIRRHPYDTRRMRQDIDATYYQDEKIVSSDLLTRVASVI